MLLNPQTMRDKKDINNKTQKVFQRISCNVFLAKNVQVL